MRPTNALKREHDAAHLEPIRRSADHSMSDNETATPDDPLQGGIPERAEGTPPADAGGLDDGTPVGPAPECSFWPTLYGRRSVRRFKPDPVPREMIDQIMHAGTWAPSSCNYQMWDLVAVDDAEKNAELAALSNQMGNAPVNIVVSYGRDFSEEGYANVQSASAMIQNMSLAAHALGLGTFWITQMGNAEKVREAVALPYDRLVIAVLAVGWPKAAVNKGPKRRPLSRVTHYNHYAGRPIPSSTNPDDWAPDLLTDYQRARVLNGLRHNKPKAWETKALIAALDELIPEGRQRPKAGESPVGRWLDVLPCTGILTDRLGRERGGYEFSIAERSAAVAEFVAGRTRPRANAFGWPQEANDLAPVPVGEHDVVSCLFRLEDLASADRSRLLDELSEWVRPGGVLLIGFVNQGSYHDFTERLRGRGRGPKGVEYVLSPDPNIGPFQSLSAREIVDPCEANGLRLEKRVGLQATPSAEEIEFRSRNFSPRKQGAVRFLGKALQLFDSIPGLARSRGRFQFLLFRKPQ